MAEPLIIDDLTGWTWVGNETLYTPSGSGASYELSYALNYKSSTQNFTSLNIYGENTTSTKSISVEYVSTSYKPVFDGEALSEMSIWYDENGNETTYELTPWKEVHFTGGTDATNADLIRLLQDNGTLTPTQTNITLDLSTIGLPAGTHSIQIKLSDDSVTKVDSELSNAVTYIQPRLYSITPILQHCTADGSNPATIQENGTATLVFTAASGYALPGIVSVTGATSSWDKSTGILTLSNPTGNVSIIIVGELAYDYEVDGNTLILNTAPYAQNNNEVVID